MRKRNLFGRVLAFVLCLALLLPMIPIQTHAAVSVNFAATGTGFKGKKLSILGDSISTYAGVSNSTSYNSTIGKNAVYYTEGNAYGVTRADTWWQQAINTLGMSLCVNNAWSGSRVYGDSSKGDAYAAWVNRCKQLHNKSGAKPDIVAVYMGTNDVKNDDNGIATFAANKSAMLAESGAKLTTKASYSFSYYIRMINRILAAYPAAEVYCFTLLPNERQNDGHIKTMEQYNQSIRDLVAYYQQNGKKVYLVDLYNDSGITHDLQLFNTFLANTLHPNAKGMDAITNTFVSSLMKNSSYAQGTWNDVVYDLEDVYAVNGKITAARHSTTAGKYAFSVDLQATQSQYNGMEVKVEVQNGSKWEDITASSYRNGKVTVDPVKGKLRITAKAVYTTKNYRWELKDGKLVTCVTDGRAYNTYAGCTSNAASLVTGKHNGSSFSAAQFKLSKPIVLRNEEPWVVEWKANGYGGSMQFSSSQKIGRNSTYLYHNPGGKPLGLGYRNSYVNEYWNFGRDISTKVPSGNTAYHTYRMVNEVKSDGSNQVRLYIDGTDMGVMNQYYIGSTSQSKTDSWVSGKDFLFRYFGCATSFYLKNNIEYIQVWEGGEDAYTDDYAGLNMSIIGDSISTYNGVTNNKTYNPLYLKTSEATFGTYYGNTGHSSYSQFSQIKRHDTWWQQTIDALDMNLLVNNAWSGSYVLKDNAQGNTTEYGAAAYKDRCVNLHKGSKKPDIIAVYLGTNDVGNYASISVGSKADVDTAAERNALYTSVNSYKKPTTSIQAYYIMLSRMLATYPNAEIYCMVPTICQGSMASGRTTALNNFNSGVKYLVDHFAGQGKKVYFVDLNGDSGLVNHSTVKNAYYANNLHPDLMGMDWITTCLINEVVEHSAKSKTTAYEVTYDLDEVYSVDGLPRYAMEGKTFSLNMAPYHKYQDISYAVTMTDAETGKQVEIPGGGVYGSNVKITNVCGPIKITAKADKNDNYYWKPDTKAFVSAAGNNLTYNGTTLVSGSYSGTTKKGTFTDVQYALQESVVLQYDKPWELEFKGGGTYSGGIMLLNNAAASTTNGNMYIHITQTNVLFGYRDANGYNNSGISWVTIAKKMGSTVGANYRKETHTFRFVNVPNGNANKIYLYVDGVKIGSMDQVKLIGSSATNANVSKINISGKDFVFNYLGSSNHPVRNCSLNYLKVWENGKANAKNKDTFHTYRWQLNDTLSALASMDDDAVYTENKTSKLSGSVKYGTFNNISFSLAKEIVLMHDRPWSISWASDGTWVGDANGAMLLAASTNSNEQGSMYLYRRHKSNTISLGEYRDGKHNNYGVYLADYGIDGTKYHKYSLVNELTKDANGKVTDNMVYLYVDGVKIAAMNTYYLGGATTGEKSDWLNGRDLAFRYIGTESFPVSGCGLDYLEINEGVGQTHDAAAAAPASVSLSSVTAGTKQATVAWKAANDAAGYQVMYATASNFASAKTATVTGTKKTVKSLTAGTKYYFKVRAYKLVDGKKVYGAWSTVKSATIK